MVYAVFVDEFSCADVVMFLTLPPKNILRQNRKNVGVFLKKLPRFSRNLLRFLKKLGHFFVTFGDVLERVC